MSAGEYYSFVYRAKNSIDYSYFSGEKSFGIADLPISPSTISKVMA